MQKHTEYTRLFQAFGWGGAEIQENVSSQPKNQRFSTEYFLTI